MKIFSPVPEGSGVEVVHGSLAGEIDGYRLHTYSPWWSLFPPALAGMSCKGADLVHASADYGFLFARSGTPLVATLHNYTSDRFMRDYSSRLQYLHYRGDLRLFSRLTLQRATVVVAISRFMADLVERDLHVTPHVKLIYNGVDHRRFVPGSGGRTGKTFRVLFCGNLNRRKRAHLLPLLAAALDERFEIHYTAGLSDGDLHDSDTPDGHAVLCPLGRVLHADMPHVYRSMDVLFMPSVREGFGLCVAEAMASGLPVVACGESATPELIEDGQGGVLCAIDDVPGYASAIAQLADDQTMARRMGDFNRARVEERFTQDRMVRDYRSLFEAVLDGGVSRQ